MAWVALDHYGERGSARATHRGPQAPDRTSRASPCCRDPIAGAEAMHLTNFSFGRGVPKPQAKDEKVQEVFDEAWDDPVNQEALTGFEAQRKLSNDLLTAANLFVIGFEANGQFRVGLLAPERVQEIVTDPEDVNRALYYLTTKIKREWDFDQDQWKPQHGEPEKIYYPHWRNVDGVRGGGGGARREDHQAAAGEAGRRRVLPRPHQPGRRDPVRDAAVGAHAALLLGPEPADRGQDRDGAGGCRVHRQARHEGRTGAGPEGRAVGAPPGRGPGGDAAHRRDADRPADAAAAARRRRSSTRTRRTRSSR